MKSEEGKIFLKVKRIFKGKKVKGKKVKKRLAIWKGNRKVKSEKSNDLLKAEPSLKRKR